MGAALLILQAPFIAPDQAHDGAHYKVGHQAGWAQQQGHNKARNDQEVGHMVGCSVLHLRNTESFACLLLYHFAIALKCLGGGVLHCCMTARA